jgi:sensitive to high expression protein 9
MDTLQSRVLTASKTLNELTGYSGIETIKDENTVLESSLAAAQTRVRLARQAYKTSNSKRGNTQREVTTLLARKDSWSPADLERFTELYRTDHVLDGEVAAAQENLTEAEAEEQSLAQRLNAGILRRYHEEQIWSDRIRRASTWGTWGLMGMNFLLFFVLQFVAEPWRRRRLVNGVVAEEKQVLGEVRSQLQAVQEALARRDEGVAAEVGPAVELPSAALPGKPPATQAPRLTGTWRQLLTEPSRWQAAAGGLFSERRAELRIKDVSIVALEGVATGAAIAASIAWALARR